MMDVTGYTSRQQLKGDFFERVIFSTGKRDYELTKKFRGHFPSVWKVITDAKKGRGDQAYTQLAKRMQRAESRVMIDSICYRLAEEYPEVPIITIHDSIMTTPEHTALIKRLMTEEFEKVGLHPTLKEEKYG